MKNSKLEFLADRIIDENGNIIMMSWEDPVMKKHAEIICSNGGDILEIGFGMGYSSAHIQNQDIKSHTIIEIHPEVARRAREWAKDKPTVIIIEADWYDVIDDLKTYDGIFYDAELDTISLPDQEPDDLLFTSIDEIAVLKEEILKLEQIIHKKSVNIVELNKNYRDMENKKDREIMRLNNKIDEYVDECDDLYLENMRLKSKYKSKICELFVPKIYNNIDYSSS